MWPIEKAAIATLGLRQDYPTKVDCILDFFFYSPGRIPRPGAVAFLMRGTQGRIGVK